MKKKVILKRIYHRDRWRLALIFDFDVILKEKVRAIPGCTFSSTHRCFYVDDNEENLRIILSTLKGDADIDISAIRQGETGDSGSGEGKKFKDKGERSDRDNEKEPAQINEASRKDIEKYRRWLEAARYPESTIRTYTSMLERFLLFVSPKSAVECNSDDLVRIVDEFIIPNGLSHSYQNQMISSVKKFFSAIYRSVIDPGAFTRPRPVHRLPNVLSKGEVKRILDSVVNEKHRVMLSLAYGCGLRRSEVLDMAIEDIDRDRRLIHVRQSKGFRDRLVPVSEKLIGMVDQYLVHYKPVRYLFEGQQRGSCYSEASLEKVFRAAFDRAGIRKKGVTLHGLRHSYATHLLESGTDIRYIQVLLGHKSSRTTEIYTHVTTHSIQNIRSPFDDL